MTQSRTRRKPTVTKPAVQISDAPDGSRHQILVTDNLKALKLNAPWTSGFNLEMAR